MAADLKPHEAEIVQQFTDLFYGKYMTEQWGIEVGYESVPPYFATMRMQLLRWQQGMDCSNSLCALSGQTGVTVESVATGFSPVPLEQPCCNDNARFQPL